MQSRPGPAQRAATTRSVLFVSDERGWPRTSGYRRRTAQLLRSVAELGPTVWVVAPRNRFDAGTPVALPPDLQEQVTVVQVGAPDRPRWRTAARWLTSSLPWPLAAGDWTAADDALSTLPQHHFDVVWAMGIDALQAVARAGITGRTTFVDADLESLKLRRRLDSGSGLRGLRRLVALIDVRRWQRLERAAAAAATGFSVCSEEERRRLGTTAFVTPNTYSIPPGSTDALRRSSDQPTLLFVGSLHYEPNVDGLRWFVTVVWPMIRREQPSARLRIVGSGGRETDWLRTADGVDLLGPVDDLEGELRAASVAIVPLRWGAGTRIKILESFAYRLPVVSTGLGAEGLDVEHRRELLIADGAQPFADGCLELLADEDYARRLGDAGHARFMARYEESVVRHALTVRLVDAVTAADADGLISDR